MTITATDFFCGAGGSSTGMVKAGVQVQLAANHWRLAIDTHSTNHPATEHDCADLQAARPEWYRRTDIAWFSPSCTSHSLAKGRKRKGLGQLDLWGENGVDPAEERSRATMREVVEFTTYHRYDIVIVENVVDIRYWQHYDEWLRAMLDLGYDHRPCYFNAQFFGVPQSRDRVYIVFWRKGLNAPNLDFRPPALCPKHGQVQAVQSFKKPEYVWGRYGKRRQYVYRCPQCGGEVQPFYVPAAAAIDWSLPSQKIGDRQRPLKPKTTARILAGLEKFKDRAVLVDLSHTHAAHKGKVHDVGAPLPTQTTQQSIGLVSPLIAEMRNNRDARASDDPLSTVVASAHHHWLVTPPMLVILKGPLTAIGVDEPLTTVVASASQHWLLTPPLMLSQSNAESPARSVDDPLYAITSGWETQLVTPPYLMSYYSRDDAQSGIDDAMPTLTAEPRHSLVTPPFMASVNYYDDRNIPVDEAMGTQTTQNKFALVTPFISEMYGKSIGNTPDQPLSSILKNVHHYLVTPPLVMTYNGNAVYAHVGQPMPTVTGIDRNALLTPEELLPECGFRMLEPHELKRGMSFPDSYVILGNKRDQVKQVGNAVACNVAEWIVARCVEALEGRAA